MMLEIRSYFAFSLDRFSTTSAADFERFGRDVFVSDEFADFERLGRDVFVSDEFIESSIFCESFLYGSTASVGSSNANSKSEYCSRCILKLNPRLKSPFLG